MEFPNLKGLEIKIEITRSDFIFWRISRDGQFFVPDDNIKHEVYNLFGNLFFKSKVNDIVDEIFRDHFNQDSLE